MSTIVAEASICSGQKTRKIPQDVGDIGAEVEKVKDLICDVCTKLQDPEFDLKQLQACLAEILYTLDEESVSVESSQ